MDAPRPIPQPPAQQQPTQPAPIQQRPIQQSPIQQSFTTQAVAPSQQTPPAQSVPPAQQTPINRQAAKPTGQKSSGTGLIVAVVLVVLLAVGGIALVLLKPFGAIATNDPTPTPVASPIAASPSPAFSEEEPELVRARQAESEERYQDAIRLYGEFQVKHALDTDPRVREILDHKGKLEKFFGLINTGLFEMNMKDYAEAERNYADALMLFPDSKTAQEGLNKAKSRGRED
jgi:hypothetical protein